MRQLRKLILWGLLSFARWDMLQQFDSQHLAHEGLWRQLEVLTREPVSAIHIKSSCAPLHSMFMQDLISERPAFSVLNRSFSFIYSTQYQSGLQIYFKPIFALQVFDLDDSDLQHICSLAQLQSLSLAYRRFTPSAAPSLACSNVSV